MSEIEAAWREYEKAQFNFVAHLSLVNTWAERLEDAEKELDRLLETPEKKKLRKIRELVEWHDHKFVYCGTVARIQDVLGEA